MFIIAHLKFNDIIVWKKHKITTKKCDTLSFFQCHIVSLVSSCIFYRYSKLSWTFRLLGYR